MFVPRRWLLQMHQNCYNTKKILEALIVSLTLGLAVEERATSVFKSACMPSPTKEERTVRQLVVFFLNLPVQCFACILSTARIRRRSSGVALFKWLAKQRKWTNSKSIERRVSVSVRLFPEAWPSTKYINTPNDNL